MLLRRCLILLLGLMLSLPAVAAEVEPENTISLSVPFVWSKPRVSYERYLGEKIGATVYAGAGKVEASNGATYQLWEVGSQVSKYFIADFYGPHVGAEYRYASGTNESNSSRVTNSDYGVFIGQKMSFTAKRRVFVVLNLGIKYTASPDFRPANSVLRYLGDVKLSWAF